ncbi:hypothetical protein C8R47DRAFT_120182 [Mycena vitilis]|nr:hypothetical protein C8R47DRAFT_120182 [Mycena vitilis]
MDIAGTIATFGGLVMKIKASIDKVGENKKNLGDLQRQVEDTVQELEMLGKGHPNQVPTDTNCQELTQSKGISAFVKAWFKRDKIEAEIKQLKDNRTSCCTQFQLFSLARVERKTDQTKVLATRIDETAARTEAKADQLINSDREKKIREWFQALDMREKQHATHALRHPDTGRWVLEGTKFAKWKEEPGCLWIRGISGTGKSVLSSIAIDHLFEYRAAQAATNGHTMSPNLGIAYFYFDFRDEKKQLVETMLRSIIMQLSEQSPTPHSVLDQHFKSCQGGKLPTYSDLLVMLNSVLAQFTGTYVVLDALDECSEHDELVEFISTLRGWSKPVHLLVTSQPRTLFLESAVFDEASVVLLESATTHSDILQFVESELASKSKLKHIKKAKDAAPKIVNKSNGMFRMAACLLQELARKKIVDIDIILAMLPDDLFGIYTRFLRPVDEDDLVYVTRILRWVAFSAEPITPLELEDALAIDFFEPDGCMFKPENKGRVDALWESLEGLVMVGPGTPTMFRGRIEPEVVTLAHSSVNDYIMSQSFLDKFKHDLTEPPSHTFLSQSCVTYLLHFEDNPLNVSTLPQYPLARYAARFWSHHLVRCHDRGVLQHSPMHLLEQGSKQYVALNCLYDVDRPWSPLVWSQYTPSPVYLCSRIGYVEGVQCLLDRGADVNATGGNLGSALQAAASQGHTDIVRLLLECGADVNTVGGKYGSALQGAASEGHTDIVRLLLEKRADVNAVSEMHGSALQFAALKGHMDIVRLLLEHGADVNATGGEYGSALHFAATGGHMDVVRLLLEHGADVNATAGEYGSALQFAATGGHMDVVRLLLEHGVRLLLEKGASRGHFGSVLQAAASRGYKDILRVLLHPGTERTELDKDSRKIRIRDTRASSGDVCRHCAD